MFDAIVYDLVKEQGSRGARGSYISDLAWGRHHITPARTEKALYELFVTGKIRKLDPVVGVVAAEFYAVPPEKPTKEPEERPEKPEPKRKGKPEPKRKAKNRTLSNIARILGGEGFSDHAANEVKRYWNLRVKSRRLAGRVARIKKAFGQVCADKLDERDRLVLGRYFAVLARQQFDTGLRLGLMTNLLGSANGFKEEEAEE